MGGPRFSMKEIADSYAQGWECGFECTIVRTAALCLRHVRELQADGRYDEAITAMRLWRGICNMQSQEASGD